MFTTGFQELIIIMVIVLILFGGKKIPELMGGLGKGIKSFKRGLNEPEQEEPEAPPQVENKAESTNEAGTESSKP